MQKHYRTNPAYLNAEEKLLWGMTARQLIIVALGCSLGYKLWATLFFLLAYGPGGFAVRLVLAFLPPLVAFVLAKLKLGGRYLEVWFLLYVRYRGKKKHLLWRSVQVRDKFALDASSAQRTAHHRDAALEESE